MAGVWRHVQEFLRINQCFSPNRSFPPASSLSSKSRAVCVKDFTSRFQVIRFASVSVQSLISGDCQRKDEPGDKSIDFGGAGLVIAYGTAGAGASRTLMQ